MNGAMVRATLDGSKTQTRRIVKPSRRCPFEFIGSGTKSDPDWNDPSCWGFMSEDGDAWLLKDSTKESDIHQIPCPHGRPGDRLYVRETHALIWPGESEPERIDDNQVEYRADTDGSSLPGHWPPDHVDDPDRPRWRPSIHMPRWASRITLEIVSVRVERLNNISEADAKAEGTTPSIVGADLDHLKYRSGFQTLWESINGAGSWALNPWVWVIEYKRVS